MNIEALSEAELDELMAATDRDRDLEVSPPGEPMPNVRRFLAAKFHHADHLLLVHQGGQFYCWNEKCWPAMEDAVLRSQLYRWFEPRYFIDNATKLPSKKPFAPTTRKVADLMDALRAVTIIETTKPAPSWFGHAYKPADELIACENGLIHWPTRTLHKHSPRFYVHHSVPFAFDPKAPPPKQWLAFLHDLWGDDAESIATLQEMFGYLLSGDTSAQKMFLLVGPKRGGKGTIGRVLTRLLGKHNVAGPTLSSLGTNFGLQDLIAKPVAIVSDARLGSRADHGLITERLLSISGEDLQNVDRKFREPWSGQLPTRFVVLTNELPRLSDSSGALASRFIVLLLQRSFYGTENPGLTEELAAELPGIFLWALDGLERLRQRGRFKPPASSQEAIQQLEDLASPVGAFLRERCEVRPDLNVEIADLYRTYRAWCEDAGRQAVNEQLFGRDLRAARPEVRVRQLGTLRIRHYVGIGIGHSRDSRVNEHCSANNQDHHSGTYPSPTSEAQSTITRESRECTHCGKPGDLRFAACCEAEAWLHTECVDAWFDSQIKRGAA